MNFATSAQEIIFLLKKAPITPGDRDSGIRDVDYFVKQSRIDVDRRAAAEELRACWRHLRGILERTGTFPSGGVGASFISGVGELMNRSPEMPFESKPIERKIPAFANWSELEFFQYVERKVETTNFRSKIDKEITIYLTKYLRMQAERPRPQRDQVTWLTYAWETVHPYLEIYGHMAEFHVPEGKHVRSKIKFMVTGKF